MFTYYTSGNTVRLTNHMDLPLDLPLIPDFANYKLARKLITYNEQAVDSL